MAYPDYPVSDKKSPHWTYTDKQLFNRDGHIVRPLEYVDAYNPNKKWTWFDFKAAHGFGGTVGVDYADKILWIPNGSILRDIYDMHIDPRYTVLTAGIPKPILASGTVSTNDWFATLRHLFGGTAHPPGGWDANGKWNTSLNPVKTPMAAAPQTTNDDLLKYLKDTLAPSIATDLGLVNQNVTTTNANVKTLENTTTQNYTPWIIGGAVLLVFLMLFKK